MKSSTTAYLLWLAGFGIFGLHRFYLGKYFSGAIWFMSFGLGGIGSLYDLITLREQVNVYNRDIEQAMIRKNLLIHTEVTKRREELELARLERELIREEELRYYEQHDPKNGLYREEDFV